MTPSWVPSCSGTHILVSGTATWGAHRHPFLRAELGLGMCGYK